MEFIVEFDGMRLDRYVRKFVGHIKQSTIEISLRKRLIKLNNKSTSSGDRLRIGDKVYINNDLLDKNVKKIEIIKIQKFISSLTIYEDCNILIINKPYGLAVQGGKKVTTSVDKLIGNTFHIVHRLDQHTTGALVLAKNIETAKAMGEKFKNKEVVKKYFALTSGIPQKNNGKIISKIAKRNIDGKEIMLSVECDDGKEAITMYRIIQVFSNKSIAYVELTPLTGRTHQLRVHMKDLNSPILSDGKYGGKHAFVPNLCKKLNLHAHYVGFNLYGKNIEAHAELPKHMKTNLDILQS